MKKISCLVGIAWLGCAAPVIAETYQFVAADDAIETQVCIAAASDSKHALRTAVRQMPAAMNSNWGIHARLRQVGKALQCNGDYVANFAMKYGATSTHQYLNRYTPAANRLASWLCHDHLAVDPVPGQGVRNVAGAMTPPDGPGLGVVPDPDYLGEPYAVYEATPP